MLIPNVSHGCTYQANPAAAPSLPRPGRQSQPCRWRPGWLIRYCCWRRYPTVSWWGSPVRWRSVPRGAGAAGEVRGRGGETGAKGRLRGCERSAQGRRRECDGGTKGGRRGCEGDFDSRIWNFDYGRGQYHSHGKPIRRPCRGVRKGSGTHPQAERQR